MQLDAYVRVSRVMGREGESFYSPEDQRRAIEGWARSHGHQIVAWHEELDESGRKDDRPLFQAMLARVDRTETEGVAVARIDRLSRNVVNGLSAIRRITDADAKFVSVAENIDPTTRFGRLNLTIVLAIAEWVSEGVREGWATAVGNAVARGAWPASTPFGYSKDDESRLHTDPGEAPYVVGIFERRGRGETWQAIADWLNADGVKPRRAEQWTRATVKDIVRHEVYVGVIRKGQHVFESRDLALVSRSTSDRARNVHDLQPTQPNGDGYPLAGLVRCAGCGYTMSGTTYKPKGKPAVRIYTCRRHHGGGSCPAPATISAHLLEPHVEEEFWEIVGNVKMVPVADAPELVDAERALAEAEADLAWWARNTEARTTFGESAYLAGARERREIAERARGLVGEARRAATGVDMPPVADLRGMWDELSTGRRRRYIAAVIDCAMVRRGRGQGVANRVQVLRRGTAPAGLPGKGRSAAIRSFEHLF